MIMVNEQQCHYFLPSHTSIIITGIYELHTSTAEFGVVLGVDTVTGQHTVILEVKESER
jgi:hypothetical protein